MTFRLCQAFFPGDADAWDKLQRALKVPEEGTPGMLEDLCLRAVIQDLSMICADRYFECLQQQGLSLPQDRHISKAKVQVFLASKLDPEKRLGEPARAGYWPWDNEAFEQVKNFLQQICP